MEEKYIIWDFDGTLYDTYGDIVKAFTSVLQELHNIFIESDHINELVKIDTKYCAKILAEEYDLDQKQLLASAREAYNNLCSYGQLPFEYVREVCNKIISTGGGNFLVTHRDRESLDTLLSAHDFHSVFTEIISADEGFSKKTSPESFNHIIKKYNLPLNRTFGTGDRELDVLAANSAGISSVFFCPDLPPLKRTAKPN